MAVTLWQTPQSFSERKSRAPSRGVLMPDTVELSVESGNAAAILRRCRPFSGLNTRGWVRGVEPHGGDSVMKPILKMPARSQLMTTLPTNSWRASPSPRICTSGCGTFTATVFSRSTSADRHDHQDDQGAARHEIAALPQAVEAIRIVDRLGRRRRARGRSRRRVGPGSCVSEFLPPFSDGICSRGWHFPGLRRGRIFRR